MKIDVEKCWGGNGNYSFRMTTPDGRRFSLRGEDWTRSLASDARNLLAYETGRDRSSFRFFHR